MVQCFGLCIVYCVFLVAGSAVQFCFDSDIHRRTDGKRRVNERVCERERESATIKGLWPSDERNTVERLTRLNPNSTEIERDDGEKKRRRHR